MWIHSPDLYFCSKISNISAKTVKNYQQWCLCEKKLDSGWYNTLSNAGLQYYILVWVKQLISLDLNTWVIVLTPQQ